MKMKASLTVEAALLCPFLCLILCGMIVFTLQLYNTVNTYAETLLERQVRQWSASELIRLEAVIEDLF
ncbi:MAG: pilus assembly protein [Lachnospiraceae bacterium]|nr:pilus assembly protein [Lachnospiraceae bacterium]MBP3577907.1 pilus assembly protein [Lachnospiraceae bacterium]